MISNSKSFSKRLKTETDVGHENSIRTDDIADSASFRSEVTISGSDVIPINAVFTEDILPEILDNLKILTPTDLVTFRLVNRCWRDAATSVILKRNLCEIRFHFGEVIIDEKGNEVGQSTGYIPDKALAIQQTSSITYKYFNMYRPKSFLSNLNQLISTSKKFPCDSFYFSWTCESSFGNLCTLSDNAGRSMHPHQIDLFNLFILYGKKIRKLTLNSEISKKAVQNMLYVHMPHLLCLDIDNVDHVLPENEANKGSKMQVFLPTPATLNMEELVLGYISLDPPANKFYFVKELISASPKLRIFKEVHTSSLEILLEMKKCHLINELHFDDPLPPSLQFTKLFADSILPCTLPNVPRLQLSKLTVWLNNDSKSTHEHDALVKSLNLILSSSKDLLEYFDFRMFLSDNVANLFIPPLPRLKCLRLEDRINSCSATTRFHFLGDVIGEAVKAKRFNADYHSVDDFNALVLENQGNVSNIPVNYFPRLSRVQLYSEKTREWESDKLMEFFAVEYLQPSSCSFIPEAIIPGDTFSTVTTLSLIKFAWFEFDIGIAKSFPLVSHLTVDCESSDTPQNWVWTAFPKLEKLKIIDLPNRWETKFVDSFFTGISAKLCAQFKTNATSSQLFGRRTKPYIGDCKNLKEFKIGFKGKLTSQFASKVTAVHGFSQVVHRTKIIFSFESDVFQVLDVKDIPETRHFLDHVADFIEIRV